MTASSSAGEGAREIVPDNVIAITFHGAEDVTMNAFELREDIERALTAAAADAYERAAVLAESFSESRKSDVIPDLVAAIRALPKAPPRGPEGETHVDARAGEASGQ